MLKRRIASELKKQDWCPLEPSEIARGVAAINLKVEKDFHRLWFDGERLRYSASDDVLAFADHCEESGWLLSRRDLATMLEEEIG